MSDPQEKSEFAQFLEAAPVTPAEQTKSEFAAFLEEGQSDQAQTDKERQREIAAGAVNLYRPANKDFAESRDIFLRQQGKRMTGPEAMITRGGNAASMGVLSVVDPTTRENVRIAGEDQPGWSMVGDVGGFAATGGSAIAGGGMKLVPKSGLGKLFGLGALGGAENAFFEATVGESNRQAAGDSAGSAPERLNAFAEGGTNPVAWAAGPAFYGAGRMTGLIKEPASEGQLALADFLGEQSGVSTDDLRITERFLRDKGLRLDGDGRAALSGAIEETGEPLGLSSGLPTRFKDVLVEGFDGNKEAFENAIRSHLRGTTLIGGDESAAIIRNSVNEDLPASREFLSEGLKDTLGSKSRLQAYDDINEQLTQIGREGYEPLLKQRLPEDREAILAQVMNGPGMNKLHEPLRTVAAGEGLDLDTMMGESPLQAAHWMQSKARQLADKSSDAVVSNAMGALRQRLLTGLNAATDGQYDVIRRQYGDTYGNQQALEFGDRFLTKANKDLDIDLMAREFAELSPAQKEAALLSVRDALQSSTGRGAAVNGPRLTKVKEEQVMTALPKVFGEAGEAVADVIRQTNEFVEGRKFVGRFGSDTASNQSIRDSALEAVQPKWRRQLGQVVSDAGSDAGLSLAFGQAVPFQSIQRQTKNFGKWIAGDPEDKLASIARVLEAPVNAGPQNAFAQVSGG